MCGECCTRTHASAEILTGEAACHIEDAVGLKFAALQGSEAGLEDKDGKVAQKRTRRRGRALCCSVGGQPVQQEQVDFADEGSGTEAAPAPKNSRKRAATSSSLLQRTSKRRAQVQTDVGKGAAVATEEGRRMLEGADSCAADAGTLGGGSNNMVVDDGSQTCRQGQVLNTIVAQG